MKLICLVSAVVLLVVLSSAGFAGYWDNVSHKADRGFSNVLGCWLELPYQTYAVTKEKGFLAGPPMGLGKGIAMMPLRILSGAADLATFYMPCPVCEWKGMVQPEYNPWVEAPAESVPSAPSPQSPAPSEPAQIITK